MKPAIPWSSLILVGSEVMAFVIHRVIKRGEDLPIVGDLPWGLPTPGLPSGSVSEMLQLLPIAAAIAGVGFLESMVISKKYGEKYKYEVNLNRELNALGVMNMCVAIFGGFPTTGSFSKTVINDDLGGRRQLGSIVGGVFLVFCLLFLTPLLSFIPRATLAGIIISAVVKLIEIDE